MRADLDVSSMNRQKILAALERHHRQEDNAPPPPKKDTHPVANYIKTQVRGKRTRVLRCGHVKVWSFADRECLQ